MGRFIQQRGWRGAIGMIAAYALVLQAFLAYSMATQAAAQDPASFAGSFFVICSSHDADVSDVPDGTDAKLKLGAHCPTCTLSGPGAAILPGPAVLPGVPAAFTAHTAFVSTGACVAYHRARAGLSRAPPQNA